MIFEIIMRQRKEIIAPKHGYVIKKTIFAEKRLWQQQNILKG